MSGTGMQCPRLHSACSSADMHNDPAKSSCTFTERTRMHDSTTALYSLSEESWRCMKHASHTRSAVHVCVREASCRASGCAQHSEHVGNRHDGHVCGVTPGGSVRHLQRRHASACGSGGGKGRDWTRVLLCNEYMPVGRGARSTADGGGSERDGDLDLGPGDAACVRTMLPRMGR